MNKLAEELNKSLDGSPIGSMLSDFGRRIYVPNGIIVQSAQAKSKAKLYNATIGIALENKVAMHAGEIKKYFSPDLSPVEIFPYAPMGGVLALREKWKEGIVSKNPKLKGAQITLPVVCSGLTNALYIVSSLFLDKNDEVVLSSMYWENYDLIFTEHAQCKMVFYDNFANGGFNLEGFEKAVESVKKKAFIVLNFPNNPTGYSATKAEAEAIKKILVAQAEKGKKLIVVADDAYYGLFFEENVSTESIFAYLANAHENILAVKCDACTKEDMVWGFRVAFITYAMKGLSEEDLKPLVQKTLGTIRGNLSNCSNPAQNIILKAMSSAKYEKEKKEGVEKMKRRYSLMKKALSKYANDKVLEPYPFNSGYFMSFKTKCKSEDLRMKLLDEYSVGTIALGENVLRIAFSSVDEKDIEGLIDTIYKAASSMK